MVQIKNHPEQTNPRQSEQEGFLRVNLYSFVRRGDDLRCMRTVRLDLHEMAGKKKPIPQMVVKKRFPVVESNK